MNPTAVFGGLVLATFSRLAAAQPAPEPSTPAIHDETGVETPAAPNEHRAELDYLVRTAHSSAASGDCDNVAMMGKRVRAIAPDYYVSAFTTDPSLAACSAGVDRKSPALASLLTVVGTLGGVTVGSILVATSEVAGEHGDSHLVVLGGYTVGAAAFAFGPSLGRIHVGGTWNWWLRLRLIGVGAFVLGAALDLAGATPRAVDAPPIGLAVGALGGGLIYTVGMIGENVAAPLDAVEYNERVGRRRELAIVPLPPRAGGAGLALVGQF